MVLRLATAARSHPGLVREHNEDAVLATPRLAMVADGVGGHAAGEVASSAALFAVAQLEKTRLDRPVAEALCLDTREARGGDRLLVCSDGLTDLVDHATIEATLAEPDRGRCADRLVELALAAGGRDNISLIVADVVAGQDADAAW